MQTVTYEYGDKAIPIYKKILSAHEKGDKLFGSETLYSGGRYIIPSQKLLKRIDPIGDMVLHAFQGHLATE